MRHCEVEGGAERPERPRVQGPDHGTPFTHSQPCHPSCLAGGSSSVPKMHLVQLSPTGCAGLVCPQERGMDGCDGCQVGCLCELQGLREDSLDEDQEGKGWTFGRDSMITQVEHHVYDK